MPEALQDAIEKEIIVKASKERVYKAITDPEQMIVWFPDVIEGKLEVGERPIFTFTSDKHRTQLYIEAANPFEYFAYRWAPASAGLVEDVLRVPNTLIEFRIEELSEGKGTKVSVKESGFSALPPEVAKESIGQNTEGWSHIIALLEKMLNKED